MKTVYIVLLVLLVLLVFMRASGYAVPEAPPNYKPPMVTGGPCGYYGGYSNFCASPLKCTVDYTGNSGDQRGTCQDSSYYTKSGIPVPSWFSAP
jgi:hypothetical protein